MGCADHFGGGGNFMAGEARVCSSEARGDAATVTRASAGRPRDRPEPRGAALRSPGWPNGIQTHWPCVTRPERPTVHDHPTCRSICVVQGALSATPVTSRWQEGAGAAGRAKTLRCLDEIHVARTSGTFPVTWWGEACWDSPSKVTEKL